MDNSIKLGKMWGIPVGLHWSLFLVFGLIAWSLAQGYFPDEYPMLSTPLHWLLGFITGLLFFGSILAHELGHAIVARRNQVAVRGITLFIFGGVAQLEQEARQPGEEFRIAIAGPLVSVILAGLFGLLWLLDQSVPYLAAPSIWLARINLLLAGFNMIPGFPLDGGRVLRAILWKWTGNVTRATRVAAFTGQLTALAFIGWGVFTMFDNFFNGLWLVFIGWFLNSAAVQSYQQVVVEDMLEGVPVTRLMRSDTPAASPQIPVSQLVDDYLMGTDEHAFPIVEGDRLVGLVCLEDVRKVPREAWGTTPVSQIMTPVDQLETISPREDAAEALTKLAQRDVRQVPVVQNGHLLGMLRRRDIMRWLQLQSGEMATR